MKLITAEYDWLLLPVHIYALLNLSQNSEHQLRYYIPAVLEVCVDQMLDTIIRTYMRLSLSQSAISYLNSKLTTLKKVLLMSF